MMMMMMILTMTMTMVIDEDDEDDDDDDDDHDKGCECSDSPPAPCRGDHRPADRHSGSTWISCRTAACGFLAACCAAAGVLLPGLRRLCLGGLLASALTLAVSWS